MEQNKKELLLKDLSARLPYGVKICFGGIPKLLTSITIKTGYTEILVEGEYGKAAYCDFISTYNNTEYLQEEITEKCKPYLRPLSSMTEEERRELTELVEEDLSEFAKFITEGHGLSHDGLYMFDKKRQLDWLLKYHFDFRGLLPKGLALEAPEGMYK